MANKPRLDALEAQKQGPAGESLAEQSAKDIAIGMVREARAALPNGVPDKSPYKTLSRDDLVNEAARLDIRVIALMTEEDGRFVLEHARQQMATSRAPQIDNQPPPPPCPVKQLKIRGLKPSPTNTWRVQCDPEKPPNVSVGSGQMSRLRNGAIINGNHYEQRVLQGFVDQGIKLVPIEEPDPEE
jgi:hypothetical protein